MKVVDLLERLPAPVLAILAIVLIQFGSGLAKDLMSGGDPIALLFLRSAIGTVLLLPFLVKEISSSLLFWGDKRSGRPVCSAVDPGVTR